MNEGPEQFIDKKRRYFVNIGLEIREALRLHKKAGLLEKKDGKRDWGNVSEHCLVEAARADVFADKLNLPADIKKDLKIAAGLHDFFKKGEREIVASNGLTWESFEQASQESIRQMEEAGFSERVIRLANSVGHGSLIEMESILKQETLSLENIAQLILHYIDDYTIGTEWVNPVDTDADQINDLDRRIDKNEANPRYSLLNEEGKNKFGEKTFECQRRIGHMIEEKLFSLIPDEAISSKELPQFIDREIQSRIFGM